MIRHLWLLLLGASLLLACFGDLEELANLGILAALALRVVPWLIRTWSGRVRPAPPDTKRGLIKVPRLELGVAGFLVLLGIVLMFIADANEAASRPDQSWAAEGFWLMVLALVLVVSLRTLQANENQARSLLASQLAALLRLGVPLPEAVEQLNRENWRHLRKRVGRLPVAMSYLQREVDNGALLSQALARITLFPPVWAAMVAVGERLDRVPEVLEHISRLEARTTRWSVREWLIPALALAGAVLVSQGLSQYLETLAPDMAPYGSVIRQVHLMLGLLLPTLAVIMWLGGTGQRPRNGLHGWLARLTLRLPGWGSLLKLDQQELVARNLWIGSQLGLSTPEILELARSSATHPTYGATLSRLDVQGGDRLSDALSRHPGLFEKELVTLVRQGEQSEDLVGAMTVLIQWYGDERQTRLIRFSQFLTLFTELLVALAIVLLALLLFLPLNSYYSGLLEGGER